MSVYTPVNKEDLQLLSGLYELGEVRRLQGIEAGVQNTNYFLYADRGDYVLTIFETIDHQQVERTMQFMHFLATHDVPSSDPLVSGNGSYVETLHHKPLAIVNRVAGTSIHVADDEQLKSLAHAVAKWHIAVKHYPERWPTRFDRQWRRQTAQQILPHLAPAQRELLNTALILGDNLDCAAIPQGIIHSDLFRDNALFQANTVSGIIDLYDIYYGPLIYDIAVIINDWCLDQSGLPNAAKARYFLRHYQTLRILDTNEIELLPDMLTMAALRFWLSRLHSEIFPKAGELALRKDPTEFENLLRYWSTVQENPACSKK